ncbi:glycosyltransferase [Pseudofulvibacter geojedonensis]|uniref:Glycosyltransferase n=1 Tax=Pseudofulvibacter geojedonensis TaxID=1123758 RepID=A0ABW3I590_9FLAO
MRVLLIGEYNRSHFFLKEGLQELGHEVTVIGLNDGFKKVAVDISLDQNYTSGIKKKIKVLLHKLFNIDLHSKSIKKQILKNQSQLKGYDIVQFINESSFLCTPKIECEIFDLIKSWNNKVFLLSCGTDYISIKYAYDKIPKYSLLTPYFEGKGSKNNYQAPLKYLQEDFKKLHKHIYKNIAGVIASDLDYHLPLKNHPKYLGLAPNPVKILPPNPIKEIKGKIIIFHGINLYNYYKKGNDIFEKALEILQKKHKNNISIITVKNIPYNEYIKSFDAAHILLDQVYSYDQGFNALEAMAKGKVVFTGAETEWLSLHNLKEDTVAINAIPDPQQIAKKLEWLILNPDKIIAISNKAQEHVIKNHNYIKSAHKYIDLWNSAN